MKSQKLHLLDRTLETSLWIGRKTTSRLRRVPDKLRSGSRVRVAPLRGNLDHHDVGKSGCNTAAQLRHSSSMNSLVRYLAVPSEQNSKASSHAVRLKYWDGWRIDA